MQRYANRGGNSNVVAYEIAPNSITVQFASGRYRYYLYSYSAPGIAAVEHMKRLAEAGSGLNSYIRTVVGSNFDDKW